LAVRRGVRPGLAGLLFLLWLLCGQGRGEESSYDPRSRIARPPPAGVASQTAAGAPGQRADGDQARPGYSVSVIFRPHRAADFYNALYAWNTSLILQVDKQGGGPASILSGDVGLRHYLADMRPLAAGRAVFLGLAVGISHVEWSGRGPDASGAADNFSFLGETGCEWNLDPALVLVGKAQYRLYDRGGHNHSGWSLHLGAGFPLPF